MRSIAHGQVIFPRIFLLIFILSVILLITNCTLLPVSEGESARRTELRSTELEIHVQQTLLAQQALEKSIQQTLSSSSALTDPPTSAPPTAPTPISSVTSENLPTQPIEASPVVHNNLDQFDEKEFLGWMKSAKILLYEDMTARLETVRYVKLTLDEMGLSYKDDGSAIGWFLDDLKSGPQGGNQWDLIIIAAEDKKGIQADFFSPVLEAADQGTSTILEVWFLNNTYLSSASSLLSRCGLIYESNWAGIPPSRAVLFTLNPEHPVLNHPNKSLSFSKSTNLWWDQSGHITYDIGDLMKLSPGSSSTLILGTVPSTTTSHGTAAVCDSGKVILQTFSSHVLSFDTMSPLWENYIYHALQSRFEALR